MSDRTFAETLGPAKVADLMSYAAAAADDVVAVVEDYAMRAGTQPQDAFENLIPIIRAALADYVPVATTLPC